MKKIENFVFYFNFLEVKYIKIQEKLKEEMKKKRAALRKQKHQVYALDNEDVMQDVR